MSSAALFPRTGTWKQPRCPSTDEWIKETVIHIYNGILLLFYKKGQNWVMCRDVDGLKVCCAE